MRTLTLCFENCEIISIPMEYVKYCCLHTCGKEYFSYEGENVVVSPIVNDGKILLSPEANNPNFFQQSWTKECYPFERMVEYKDITHIQFNEDERLVVKWADGNEEINFWQTTEINSDRSLIIIFRGE